MTTEEVNGLGIRLAAADADGNEEVFRAAAYAALTGLGVEHARADGLAARVHALAWRDPVPATSGKTLASSLVSAEKGS
jgi:hypothetical protein